MERSIKPSCLTLLASSIWKGYASALDRCAADLDFPGPPPSECGRSVQDWSKIRIRQLRRDYREYPDLFLEQLGLAPIEPPHDDAIQDHLDQVYFQLGRELG